MLGVYFIVLADVGPTPYTVSSVEDLTVVETGPRPSSYSMGCLRSNPLVPKSEATPYRSAAEELPWEYLGSPYKLDMHDLRVYPKVAEVLVVKESSIGVEP